MSLPQKELLRDSSPHSLKQVFHLLSSLYLSPGVRIYSCICLLDCRWLPHGIPRSTGVLEEHLLDDLMNKGTPSNELHCNEEKKGSLSKMNIQVSKIPLSIPIEKDSNSNCIGPLPSRVLQLPQVVLVTFCSKVLRKWTNFFFQHGFYMPQVKLGALERMISKIDLTLILMEFTDY